MQQAEAVPGQESPVARAVVHHLRGELDAAEAGMTKFAPPVTVASSSRSGLYVTSRPSSRSSPGPMPAWTSIEPLMLAKMPMRWPRTATPTIGMSMPMLRMFFSSFFSGKTSRAEGSSTLPETSISPLGSSLKPTVAWSQGASLSEAEPAP